MKKILALALALGFGGAALAAPVVSDPTALVRKLYAPSRSSGDPLWWSYLTGRAQSTFQQVLRAEKKSGDELIDADFLCQCQDDDGLHIVSINLSHQTPTSVSALVRFTFSDKSVQTLTIDLVKVGSGWRIAQMTNSDHRTFTAENEQALKDAGH
ncbi:MAG TPA: hypothetical protein VGL73_00545 [Caulobacteraceae bacterium]